MSPCHERLALGMLLLATLALRAWRLDQPIVDLGRIDALHAAVRRVFDPHLARAVDDDLSHRVARQPVRKRGEVGVEIDAPLARRGGGARQRMDLGRHLT